MSERREIRSVVLNNDDTWEALYPQIRDLVIEGRFILGPELDEFERAAAERFGCDWCVGTSSGTSALTLALRAAGLPDGARVALPANTFFATFEAVMAAGLTPVLLDHDRDYLIDLEKLASADVEAVIAVHLYGLPVDMEPLMQLARARGWWVVEDCAQAHGATVDGRPVGSLGNVGAFSAYPTKNLGAWGDAGFVVGTDRSVEETLRALRHHGQERPNEHKYVSGTDRMDNIQALVLTHKLGLLSEEIAERRRIAEDYRAALSDDIPDLPRDRGSRRHAFHQFVIRVDARDAVRETLFRWGVSTSVHYPTPIHRQPGAAGLFEIHNEATRAESWAHQLLSLPMHRYLTTADMEHVAKALRAAISSSRSVTTTL